MGETGTLDRDVLAFEAQWFRLPGHKEQAIRERFGITATRYYQRLNRLLDDPDAEQLAPVLVHRLRRIPAGRRPA